MTAHPLDDLDLLIAVANTAHDLSTPDELRDGTSAAAWWHDLSGERTPNLGSQADVELLRAARAVIRRLGLRNNGVSTDVELGPLATLPLNLILDARPGLAPPAGSSTPAREIAGRVVAALIRWSGNPQAARLKACPGPDCAWVFHDTTRNRSRRWCDMAACGNRAKAAAFRARAH